MQPFPSRFSRRSFLVRAAVLLAAGGSLGACDRHGADDLPDSYGHGSSHNKSTKTHETDSRADGSHFSDSAGFKSGEAHGDAPAPAATPGTPDAGRMFPTPH